MKIAAIQCGQCDDIIYSRARHDFRWCNCKHCAIDGGRDYIKTTGIFITYIEVDVNATEQELYNDWNTSANKYGVISLPTNSKDIKDVSKEKNIPSKRRSSTTTRNNKTASDRQKN